MCPFCIGTAVWIAAGVVSTGGVSALAVTKLWNRKAHEREQGGSHEDQRADAMKTMINTNGSNGSESKMAVQSGSIVLDSSKIVIRTGINLQKMSFRFCMPKNIMPKSKQFRAKVARH